MSAERNHRVIVPSLAGQVVTAVGILVLAGWFFDIATLKNVLPGLPTMKVNAALSFILSGAAVWSLAGDRLSSFRLLAIRSCAVLAASLGGLSLVEDLGGADLGIDQLLFQDNSPAGSNSAPGRMSPATAFTFILTGGALLLASGTAARGRGWAQWPALLLGLVGFLAVIGYGYNVQALYRLPPYSSMALHTALLFVLLAVGLLFLEPARGWMGVVNSERVGGIMARRLLPLAVVLPVVLGWVCLGIERAGWITAATGTAILVSAMVMVFCSLTWFTAASLNRAEARRAEALAVLQAKSAEVEAANRLLGRLAAIVECCDDAIVSKTMDGIVTTWNPGAEKMFGFAAAEAIGQPMRIVIPPERAPEEADFLVRLGRGESVRHYETRRQHKDGRQFDASVSLSPIHDAAGRVVGISTIARDITVRKQVEAALRESEMRIKGIVESAMDAIISVNDEQKIVLLNPAAERMFGYQERELLGGPLDALIPSRHRKAHCDHVHRFGCTGVTTRAMGALGQISGLRANGEEFPIEASISQIKVDGQRLYTVILRDITGRKRAEEELRQHRERLEELVQARTAELEAANKELESFAYSVSHDLRAPLRGIAGWSQALVEDYGDKLDAQAREYLAQVCGEAQRMGQLIDDLLEVSRVTRAEMRREPVDLTALARGILADLFQHDRQRQVETVVAPGLTTTGDPQLLRLVLENLLGNAWKFTGKRDQARIEIGTVAAEVTRLTDPKAESGKQKAEMDQSLLASAATSSAATAFFVRDNGAGFDMAHATKLFAPFQRMHRLSEFPGTGIGLATVQRIVHRHGGRVWAESAREQGATFYFTMPTHASNHD